MVAPAAAPATQRCFLATRYKSYAEKNHRHGKQQTRAGYCDS